MSSAQIASALSGLPHKQDLPLIALRNRKADRRQSKIATKKDVRRMIDNNTEFKAIYTHINGLNPYTGGLGYMVLLNGCSQGTGLSSRQGRVIQLRSVSITLQHRNASGSTGDYPIRVILFIDKEPHGVAPTGAQLLRTTDGQGLDEAPRNLDYRNRFVILKDKWIQGDPFNNNGALRTHYHKFVKYRTLNLKTVYDASNNADITDINKGALYCYFFNGDSAFPPSAWISAVVRFTDA